MTRSWSPTSLKRLNGVHADLRRVLDRALQLSPVDFGIAEGLRSRERQAELFRNGKSKTMNSRHLTGHAVDVMIIHDGAMAARAEHYYPLAQAMRAASAAEQVPIRWGGCWTLLDDVDDVPAAVAAYVARCKTNGTKPLIDAVHFELPIGTYP